MADKPAEAATETAPPSLPASPLASADASKHDGGAAPKAEAASEAKPAEAKADAKAEAAPAEAKPAEAKPEAAADAKPEAKADTKESAAESGEKAPPEKAPEQKAEAEKVEAKPEDKKADSQETAADKPQAPPVYDALKLPEGTKLDETQLKKFDELLGKTELATNADHTAISALRQDLANLYVEEVNRIGNEVAKHQVDVWNRLIEQRVNDLKKDPELGGNRIETALGNAKYALESLVPGFSKEDAAEWIKVADAGGVSHHRLTIKLLNKIFDLFAEPQPIEGQTKPVNNQTRRPGDRGWYDSVDAKAAS